MTYEQAHKFLEVKQREMTKNRGLYNEIEISINGIAIEAVEKQISQKPIDKSDLWAVCPVCGGSISLDNIQEHIENEENTFCEHCGQRLDWSD